MSFWKDRWLEAYEQRCGELEDQGVHPELAAEIAEREAEGIARDRLADMADFARSRPAQA